MTGVPVRRRRHLAVLLSCLFLLTMVMGAGPGLHLVNPDPGDPAAAFTVGGLPTLYAWGLVWYGAQLAVILVAYFKLWRSSENGAQRGAGAESSAPNAEADRA